MNPISLRTPLAALLLVLGSLVALGGAGAADPKTAMPPKPNASLDPAAVVRIQLDALKHVDEPAHDAGFAIVFAFASPGNQAETGPLKHFAQMIRSSYSELLNHRSAMFDAIRLDGDRALQAVEIVDHAGSVRRYVFLLSKQTDPPCAGCWMTDSVYPDPGAKPRQEI